MNKFLNKQDLWAEIKSLSILAKKSLIAVAYLGNGSANKLKLKQGDILVTCMSLQALQTGQTNPYEVEKFLRKGIRVYTKNYLHAKVYIFDEKVIISSANLSKSSEISLIEAGVITDEKNVVKAAKLFVQDNCEQEIDEPYLIWAKKHYVSNGDFVSEGFSSKEDVRYWLMNTQKNTLSNEVLVELEKDEPIYKKKMADRRKFVIDYIEVGGNSSIVREAKEGDRLIEIYHNNDRIRVHAPKMILSNTRIYSHDKPIIRVAEPIIENSFLWNAFKSHLTKGGIYSIGKTSTRELRGHTLSVIKSFFGQ